MARPVVDLIKRFWQHVEPKAQSECWEWKGSRDALGYGQIFERLGHKNWRVIGAHRLSLMIHSGEKPSKKVFAMHSCDNPSCVNPHHLSWGTQAENMKDAKAKGRTRNKPFASGDDHPFRKDPSLVKRGSKHQNAICTEDTVRRIYALRMQGLSSKRIAPLVGISWQQVGFIWSGRSWSHMLDEPGAPTVAQMRAAGPRVSKAPSSQPHP